MILATQLVNTFHKLRIQEIIESVGTTDSIALRAVLKTLTLPWHSPLLNLHHRYDIN
jgi:hypothetical protein